MEYKYHHLMNVVNDRQSILIKSRERENDKRDLKILYSDQRPAGQSRAIAHACAASPDVYATSPGLAWSACFFIPIFDGQTVRMKNTRSMQFQAM
jgi:hypothetical protein